jgi:predicted Ser/Thr protein kinase
MEPIHSAICRSVDQQCQAHLFHSTKPQVLSMDVDPSNEVASEYRILIGDQIKYIVLDPGILDSEILSFPPDLFSHLPELPPGDWTRARIFQQSSRMIISPSNAELKGVTTRWHQNVVDVRSLIIEERLSTRVHVVNYNSKSVVAKIARFEFEVPLVETETAVYQVIDGHGIGPVFLGHLIEHNRVMGFLIERMEGHHAGIPDLGACQAAVERLHSLRIIHGDLNRHNFIVSPSGATLIDFENARKDGSKEEMQKEFSQLAEQLTEESGRGGRSIRMSDDDT